MNDDIRRIGPLSQGLKDDAQGLRAHGFTKAAPHIEMRAAEARALEARLWSAEEKIAELEQEREDFRLGLVDCLKSRSDELRRLEGIVEMAWKGYGYDQEWDCDCLVCAAIRTRTPHDTDGGV